MFGFGTLPTIGPVTPVGMQVLGVFLGAIWGWSTVDKIWPSALAIIALGLGDYCTVAEAIEYGMKQPVTWQILLMLIISGGINETQFPQAMSQWLLSKKIVQGRPWLINIAILLCTYLLAIIVLVPAIFLMWGIFYSLLETAGYDKKSKYAITMTIGMFIAYMSGIAFFPFTGIRAILGATLSNMIGSGISYGLYMLSNFLVTTLTLLIYLLAMKYLFKVDVKKLQGVSLENLLSEKVKMTISEKVYVVGFFVGLSICSIIDVLPKEWALTQFFHSLTISGIFALVLAILGGIHFYGKPVLDVQNVSGKSIQWGVIFIIISSLPIINALSSKETGINALLDQTLTPIFLSGGSLFFVVLVCSLAIVLTNMLSNLAVGMMILPVIVTAAPKLDLNPSIIALLVIFSVNIAFILPSASPVGSLLHGNANITAKDVYKYGCIGLLIMALVILCIVYPLLVFIV